MGEDNSNGSQRVSWDLKQKLRNQKVEEERVGQYYREDMIKVDFRGTRLSAGIKEMEEPRTCTSECTDTAMEGQEIGGRDTIIPDAKLPSMEL